MRLRMNQTTPGHDEANGITLPVRTYVEGQSYELGQSLAKCFLELGVAEIDLPPPLVVTATVAPAQDEALTEPAPFARTVPPKGKRKKALGAAPENKDGDA